MSGARSIAVLASFVLSLGLAPAALAADAGLLKAANNQEASVIRSLQDMVLIDSGSENSAGIGKLTDYLEKRLKGLGATTERIPSPSGGADMLKGTLRGTGSLRAMLIAHMDTVYEEGILESEPYRREGNRLYGPGIADDKGGIAVVLHALEVLRDAKWRDYAVITVVFNADEEIGSRGSGATIASLGAAHEVVLSFEPCAAKEIAQAEGVLLSAAGTGQAVMRVKGVAAHAGAAADQGKNALLELAYQLDRTADIAKDMPDAQLNWTTAQAGTKRNQIPAEAEAGADVRVLSDAAREKLLSALQEKVGESQRIPGTTTTVAIDSGRPPYVGGDKGERLAKLAKSIYAELDNRPLITLPPTFGGTDAGFAASSGKPAVLESMGLAGWGYHAKNEYIEIDSIVPRLYLTARMLQELSRDQTIAPNGTD